MRAMNLLCMAELAPRSVMRMNIEYIETQEVNEVDNVNGIHNLLLLQNKVNISGPG